jgi:hypothetical protein
VHGRPTQVVAQLAEHLAHRGPLVGDEQQEVARRGVEGRQQRHTLLVGEEPGDGRIERSVLGHLQPHQAPRAELLGPVREPVELVAAVVGRPARQPDALDRRRAGEGLEPRCREERRELDQLHPEAEIGLVDAVTIEGLVPRDALDRPRALAGDGLGGVEDGLADGGEHIVLVGEAHLGIELHELVLPVGAQVLVAQAPGDLVVAIDAAHHQQLLEQLRALGQGVERAGRLP